LWPRRCTFAIGLCAFSTRVRIQLLTECLFKHISLHHIQRMIGQQKGNLKTTTKKPKNAGRKQPHELRTAHSATSCACLVAEYNRSMSSGNKIVSSQSRISFSRRISVCESLCCARLRCCPRQNASDTKPRIPPGQRGRGRCLSAALPANPSL